MSFIIKHVYSVHRRPKQREKTWVTSRQEHAISTLPLQVICRNPALTSIRSWITVIEFSMKMRSLYCRRSVLWVNWPQNRRTRNTLAAPYIKKHQSLQLNFRIIVISFNVQTPTLGVAGFYDLSLDNGPGSSRSVPSSKFGPKVACQYRRFINYTWLYMNH